MQITVSNGIIVREPTKAVIDYCREHLILDNPDYYKKEKLGKWTGNTPQTISLYERRGDALCLPFGCFADMWRLHPVRNDWTCKISPVEPRTYKSNINLYPYQENAVNAILRAKNGIVGMPCGSGKTQTALDAVARIGGRTLWLTHTQDLLNQSKTRAEQTLEIDGTYGKITDGKVDIGSHITFATVQTMSKIDLSAYRDCFDVIICDECQHAAGSPTRVTQFYKVLSALSARYKIGLTATPKRADGLERSMFALLGDKICEVSKEEVNQTTCPVKIQRIETGYQPDYNKVLCGDGTIDYAALIDDMISNQDRREVVQNVINNLDGSAIVLANRVAYISELQKNFSGRSVCLSTLGSSKKAKAERKDALRKLNDGELDAIFATYQLSKEGLDVPSLRYVVFATPERDETTVIQSAGRVGRKADGKTHGTVIDFIDDFGMYRGWAKKRTGYYKKIDAIY